MASILQESFNKLGIGRIGELGGRMGGLERASLRLGEAASLRRKGETEQEYGLRGGLAEKESGLRIGEMKVGSGLRKDEMGAEYGLRGKLAGQESGFRQNEMRLGSGLRKDEMGAEYGLRNKSEIDRERRQLNMRLAELNAMRPQLGTPEYTEWERQKNAINNQLSFLR